MSMTLFGIKSCDTCRKARRWLEAGGVDYRYHDLREDGLDASMLRRWTQQLGWEALLNRRSTTWRGLDESERAGLDADGAVALMLRQPTLVKRPILETGDGVLAGFSESRYQGVIDG